MNHMTNEEITKESCKKAAKRDIDNGLGCTPERHGAKSESAWATWYKDWYYKMSDLPTATNPF